MTKDGKPVAMYKESHALLIGVSRYTAGWPQLESVPGELDSLEAALKRQGFTTDRVNDPTSESLKAAFERFIDKYGFNRENRLLVFFSGHGHTRMAGKKGYIVPADAPDPTLDEIGFYANAIEMEQVTAWARRIEAKHVLFLFDSCFSGTVFKAKDLPRPRRISAATAKPVREFITAGSAGETVPARSVFVPSVIRGIEGGADTFGEGYVTGTELGLYLQHQVMSYRTGQTPQFGKMRDPDFDEGDFVFVVPRATTASRTSGAGSPAGPGAKPERAQSQREESTEPKPESSSTIGGWRALPTSFDLKRNLPLKVSGTIRAIAFSRDGRFLAAGGCDMDEWAKYACLDGEAVIQVWDVVTGGLRQTFAQTGDREYHSVAFSPDGRLLASGSGGGLNANNSGTLKLWDLETGSLKATLLTLERPVTFAGFSPDGRLLAARGQAPGNESWLGVFNPITGNQVWALKSNGGGGDESNIVAFSPDGALLSWGGSLREAASGAKKLSLAEGGATSVAFSPDGRLVAVSSPAKKRLMLYAIASGAVQAAFPLKVEAFETMSLAFSPDGLLLASAQGDSSGTRLWETASGSVKANLPCGPPMAYSPGGRLIACKKDGMIRLWEPGSH